MSKYLTGSSVFFSCYEDFQPGDIDEIEIVDEGDFNHLRQLSGMGRCLFQLKRKANKQEYIDWDMRVGLGMVIARYLTPDFVKAIEFNIEDLKQLQPLAEKCGPRHEYLKYIYYCYVGNNDFYLTDCQRQEAYKKYKEARGDN